MAIVTVGPVGKDHVTITAALAFVLATANSPFTEIWTVDVFNDVYVESIDVPAVNPTASFRLIVQGADGEFPEVSPAPNNVTFRTGERFVTIRNMELVTQDPSQAIALNARDTICEDNLIRGINSASSHRFYKINGAFNVTIRRNFHKWSTNTLAVPVAQTTTRIYHNIFFGIEQGIFIFGSASGSQIIGNSFLGRSASSSPCIEIAAGATTAEIENNIMSGFDFGINADPADISSSDNNDIFNMAVADFFDKSGAGNRTLAQWRTDNSLDLNSLLLDPEFINTTPGSEDLHIEPSSPMIGAGKVPPALAEINIDIDGDDFAVPRSIGADEPLLIVRGGLTEKLTERLTELLTVG